ncbi:MAG: LacI family DNA-binding transcriptional regulator, partial [Trebonia sp.]
MTRRPSDRDQRSRAANLQDIADRAGVSLATASRVLGNGSRRVSDELIDRVTRAAADLGYSANLPARTVATGHSDIVGVLVHDISDPYFSTIVAGAMPVIESRGLPVLGSTANRPQYEVEYVATMRAQRAQALILVGSRS